MHARTVKNNPVGKTLNKIEEKKIIAFLKKVNVAVSSILSICLQKIIFITIALLNIKSIKKHMKRRKSGLPGAPEH